MNDQSLGARLKRWRVKQGFSQDDVAKLVGCTVSAVVKYEQGFREPHAFVRDRILLLLKKGE